ncbi:MAG: uroporphyrin-III C-methyltransferase [Mariniblastus sp.]|jgi:uroporphyrin-III C-methyltransferase
MIFRKGSVYLVGAGPGDPELITVRGMRLIEQADTIIHDRLIPHEVLHWCRPEATLIDVGKYPDHHRVSQAEINELLVEHARRGNLVVRLKGGDPFVFGRGQEEVEACREHQVPCHLVPGISSCIAGPAAAGIPVTTRGVARSFTVMTGQTAPELGHHDVDFGALAKMETLVLLMARKNLRHLTTQLIEHGRDPETPVACIERATFDDQRVTASTLRLIADQVESLGLANPMVTVIGEVASLVNPDLVELPAEIQEHFYAVESGE